MDAASFFAPDDRRIFHRHPDTRRKVSGYQGHLQRTIWIKQTINQTKIMTEKLTLEEQKILNDPDIPNAHARGLALERLRATMTPAPPGPPEWATPAVAAELRNYVDSIRSAGADIIAHDELTKQHRQRQQEIRERIYVLENPTTWPTDETALELAKLKSLAVQMAAFLGSADARRSALVAQITASIQRLVQRLYRLTGRSNWSFEHPDPRHFSTIHEVCAREVERVLAGTPDGFDLMNQSRAPVNIFTANTIGNQTYK